MSPHADPATEFATLKEQLAALASQVLAEVERAVAGWEEADPSALEAVSAMDEEVNARSSSLESHILTTHRNWPAFASDLRLLHVGLISAVALERVGNLAVAIARLAATTPPAEPGMEGVRSLIREMGDRAVDALAQATQALARSDLAAAERATELADSTVPMLDRVMRDVAETPGVPQMRTWSAAAVLVARHLERVANNAAEIASRVHFLVTGRGPAPAPG